MISYEFIAENYNELEADFLREYGIDLRDALYGPNRIGMRRLSALIAGLSPQSATMRRTHTGGVPWGQTEELLATLCELIDLANRMYFQTHFKGRVWDPVEIPRPYTDAAKENNLSSTEDVMSFFGTMAASDSVYVDNPDVADTSTSEE